MTERLATISRRRSAADGSSSASRPSFEVEGLNPYRCSDCSASYRQHVDFNEHLRTAHPCATIGYVCSFCGLEHEDFEALRRHVTDSHSNRSVYECAHCHCWFRQRLAMERHLQRHAESLKRRTCNLCSVVFSTRQKFKAHWSSRHELARDHVCNVCGERFTRSYNLRRHELAKHRRDGKTWRWAPPRCDMCGKIFSRKQHLDQHRCRARSDDESERFLCAVCNRGFGSKGKIEEIQRQNCRRR